MARLRGRRRRWHGGRAMLNQLGHQSTASIVAEIEDSRFWKGEPGSYDSPNYCLKLSDCDRAVSFDLDFCGDFDDYENALYKVDTMIGLLKKFRRGMVIERAQYEKRLALHPEWSRDD